MNFIFAFYNGTLNDEKKLRLRCLLVSRLQLNKQANQYAKFLGLYRLPDIELWSLSGRTSEVDTNTFNDFFNQIAASRLFSIKIDAQDRRGPYYREPARYLAFAMALAGYNQWDVTDAMQKLWEARKQNKFTDMGIV